LPKKTTETIIESKNDYLIGVKLNQPNLYHQIEKIIADKTKQTSACITLEVNKGRIELRNTMVSNYIEDISKGWIGLQQVVGVHRIVIDKGKQSEEMAYFISSRNENAFLYNEGVRGHWQIENSLHWVKDVTLKEDESKIKMGNAPQNISTVKNICINILRVNEFKNLAQAIRLVSNDIKVLYEMIV
jgi:predicted transposase YbfD/YdcC